MLMTFKSIEKENKKRLLIIARDSQSKSTGVQAITNKSLQPLLHE